MSTEITTISDQVKALPGQLTRILVEIESVKSQPRVVLMLASAFLEDMIDTLCEHYVRNYAEFRRLSASQKLYLLVELKRIDDSRARTLDWIRTKRNKVAHSALFQLDNSHMPEWADEHHKTPDKTFSLCIQIIGCFWNEHIEVFRSVYLEQ